MKSELITLVVFILFILLQFLPIFQSILPKDQSQELSMTQETIKCIDFHSLFVQLLRLHS